MATTGLTQPKEQPSPRPSEETERRNLLSFSATPSAATSVIDFGSGSTTPRALSPARSQRETQDPGYKGFPSEAAYMEALRAWAEEKKYLEPQTGLQGFYGEVTMDELAKRPKLEVGLRKRWRERRSKKRDGKEQDQ